MKRCLTFALALAIGGFASRVEAIEMFTNFNNGTELGTRPYGIEIMSPVRYHAYPHARWFQRSTQDWGNSGDATKAPITRPAVPPAAPPSAGEPLAQPSPAGADSAIIVRPAETAARRSAARTDDTWIRSSSFIPPAQAE